MQRALIIGCGYTGMTLARRLERSGVAVTGTATRPGIDPGLAWRALDLLASGPLELPEADDAVVYYMVSTLERQYTPSGPHMRPMQRCLDALSRRQPRGLVYISSTSVYGDRQGQWVDEESPVAPASPWAHMRVELEQTVWRFGQQRGLPACVVRPPEIYGPGRGPVARLRAGSHLSRSAPHAASCCALRSALQGGSAAPRASAAPPLRAGQHLLQHPLRYSNRIHVEDLATVLHELGVRRDPPLLLTADSLPATTLEVYRFAAQQMGLPPDFVGVGGSESEPRDPNRRALAQESKRCSNQRLLHWLGQPLRFASYREGIMAILAAEAPCG